MRALEKDRDLRFNSAEEIARALGYGAPMHPNGKESEASAAVVESPAPASTPPPTYQDLYLIRFDNVSIPLQRDATILNRPNVNPGDDLISRKRHAQVVCQGDNWWLQDLGSTNGTFANGIRIFDPVILQPGDEIRLGNTTLSVAQR
jgi:hypothetical protein